VYLAGFRFSILFFPATLGSLIGCSGAVVASGASTGDAAPDVSRATTGDAAHDARAKPPAEAGPDGGEYDYIDGSLAACSPACDKTQALRGGYRLPPGRRARLEPLPPRVSVRRPGVAVVSFDPGVQGGRDLYVHSPGTLRWAGRRFVPVERRRVLRSYAERRLAHPV
jgi:hypothetical protein